MNNQATINSQPNLMSPMSDTNQNIGQETPIISNNIQSDMNNQVTINSQPNLMSPMSDTNQNIGQETPIISNNIQSDMNNQTFNNENTQQPNMFSNVQTIQPMNQMAQGSNNGLEMKNSNNKKFLIIGVGVLVIIIAVLVYFFIFSNNGTVVNMEGVNVWIPKDYTQKSQYGYDELYVSQKQDVIIGINTQSAYGTTLDQFMANVDSVGEINSFQCGSGTKKSIKGQEWAYYSCSSDGAQTNMYVTVKDNEAYMVIIVAETGSTNKITSIEKKIEQNLEFAN